MSLISMIDKSKHTEAIAYLSAFGDVQGLASLANNLALCMECNSIYVRPDKRRSFCSRHCSGIAIQHAVRFAGLEITEA